MRIIKMDNDKLEECIVKSFDSDKRDAKYNINDVCLVRTTDIFPSNGIINSRAIDNAILKMYSPYFKFGDKNIELISYISYRTTIHFTLNGLVGNHSMGNFSNRKYFIFDRLFNQINNNLVSLRSEDTYFKDSYSLSRDASICMSSDSYNNLSDIDKEMLLNYKVFIYDIDKYIMDKYDISKIEIGIVKYVLNCLGYPSFVISSHGYSSSSISAILMEEFIFSYAKEHNISRRVHFGSPLHISDNKIELDNMLNSSYNHYEYIVNNSNISNNFKNKLLNYLPYLKNSGLFFVNKYIWASGKPNVLVEDFKKDVDNFLKIIGINEYNRLTKEYNNIVELERDKRLVNIKVRK